MRTRRIAYLGLLTALAFVFSYIEFLIPVNIGVPGEELHIWGFLQLLRLYFLILNF